VGPSVQDGAGDNRDPLIIRGFGREWSNFRQDADHLSHEQRQAIFDDYFRIFPWYRLPPGGGVGLDIGCGKRALVDVDAAKEPHLSEIGFLNIATVDLIDFDSSEENRHTSF